jgi:hypothetical protein
MGLHGVLHGEFVEIELLPDCFELGFLWFEQADPAERVIGETRRPGTIEQEVTRDPDPVPVQRSVDDHTSQTRAQSGFENGRVDLRHARRHPARMSAHGASRFMPD